METQSFLPEDYLAEKAQRRTNLICLTLFAIVMIAVFGAFLVTNRQWSQVKARQTQINERYQEAGEQIQQLTRLENQMGEILNKAELAAALVERVPRSYLLAELINRMPRRLSLLEFKMKSEQIQTAVQTNQDRRKKTGRLSRPTRGKTKAEAQAEASAEQKQIQPPRYQVNIMMTGVAPTDLEVSKYLAQLTGYDLLRSVNLEYSEEKEIEGQLMREFQIRMALAKDADIRYLDPEDRPGQLRDPMRDNMRFGEPSAQPTIGNAPTENPGD